MAGAAPLVQIGLQFNPPTAIVLDFQQRPPFGTHWFRERIREAKGDELNQARLVAVRQITALVPALKTAFNIFLQDEWRVLSYFGLGVSLLVLAWVYQKYVFGGQSKAAAPPESPDTPAEPREPQFEEEGA